MICNDQIFADKSKKERPGKAFDGTDVWELAVDVLILSEIPRGSPDTSRWVSSADNKAVVALTNNANIAAVDCSKDLGFVRMQLPDVLVYSCYWTLYGILVMFEEFLAGLEMDVRMNHRPNMGLIVAGDFNLKSPAWGSRFVNARGQLLERFAASLGFWPENVGSVPTFAVGDRSLVMDVTFANLSGGGGSSICRWRVRDDVFSNSDYRYVEFALTTASVSTNRQVPTGWALRKLDQAKLEIVTKADVVTSDKDDNADRAVERIGKYHADVSNAVMPIRSRPSPRRSAFWWSDEIADLRRLCVASQRAYQRAGRRRQSRDGLRDDIRDARRNLRKTIRRA